MRDLMTPIEMVLFCPACGLQHIDEATETWTNPPHRTHLCLGCGNLWRPANVPTCGVKTLTDAEALASTYREENERLRELLEALRSAATDLLVGIVVHNRLPSDSPGRLDDIAGPVVSELSRATHAARQALTTPRTETDQ